MSATRILATLGPASSDAAVIHDLVLAGASAFRLNLSHGRHDELAEVVAAVRRVEEELGCPLALEADLAGPKLRTAPVAGKGMVELRTGEEVVVTAADPATTPGRIAVAHRELPGALEPGHRLLIDDGRIEIQVTEPGSDTVRARVVFGGTLASQKGINLPDGRLSVPAVTEKDAADLAFVLEQGVDWVALSFVQEARDVVDLKRRIALAGHRVPVIAKIERPSAVEGLAGILDVTDGIMVARGDLGVELGPEVLPTVQKEIIDAARCRGRLVITATEMLESMTRAARPTRAEATDVANAVFDGTDVVMLSQETAVGAHPARAVATMRAIADKVEESPLWRERQESLHRPDEGGIAHAAIRAACVAAEEAGARALAVFTSSGRTAFEASAWRPHVPIHAVTSSVASCRRLALAFGVSTLLLAEQPASVQDLYRRGVDALLSRYLLMIGDVVVLLSGAVLDGQGANTIKVHRVGRSEKV